uniref:Ribonuclease HII n=1 Tax=viral metagenome TaxID=1070528 RepID=A0A6C0BRL1_9ZZZZ
MPLLSRDLELFERTAGCDEAGRGALAGPVVIAAVILPRDLSPIPTQYLKDSKKLSKSRIHSMHDILQDTCEVAISIIDNQVIDDVNIYWATMKGMKQSLQELRPSLALIDGNAGPPDLGIPWFPVPQGDNKQMCIAAASIIAKFTRDNIMLGYAQIYPGWRFEDHKGYGAADHMARIRSGDYTPIHRRSFRPLKTFLTSC